MEGMRGYAALLVFLVHHHTLFGQLLPRTGALYKISQLGQRAGNSGVDLFFILSGYLVYGHVLHKGPPYFSYLRKRMRRIYPAFLGIFCVYLLASYLVPAVSKLPPAGLARLAYLAENLLFLPGVFPIDPMITVTWSLSYEVFFYLSIPILIGVTGMRQWQRSGRMLFFLTLLFLHWTGSYFDVLPHVRMSLFAVGIVLYEVAASGWAKGRLSARGEIVAIGLYLAALAGLALFKIDATAYRAALLSVGLFGVTLYSISFPGLLRSFFTATPLRWLGNMSYTYYLCHALLLHGAAVLISGITTARLLSPFAFLLMMAVNVALTLAVSRVLFNMVEKPFSLTSALPVTPRG